VDREPGQAKAVLRRRLRGLRNDRPHADDGPALARQLRAARAGLGLSGPLVLAGFHPTASEPDVLPCMAQAHLRGDRVLLPRTLPEHGLQWVPWNPAAVLAPDRFGVLAPTGAPDPAAPASVAVFLVPALAVDRLGTRLGHGAGYYDRALGALPPWPRGPLRIAVVHPWEVVSEPLPAQSHDARMDVALTAQGWTLLRAP
jgi:5-formyltetrahydrofolate cyclo-ligase